MMYTKLALISAGGLTSLPSSRAWSLSINSFKDAVEHIADEVENVHDDIKDTVVKAGDDIADEAERFHDNVKDAVDDAADAVTDVIGDVSDTVEKAFNDIIDEVVRGGDNTVDLVVAVGNFVENQVNAYPDIFSDAAERLSEGKIADALWHIATDQLKETEENAFEAFTESTLLNFVASSAASIYGGPGGAAAYSAWYTYKATGNLEAAIKAGALAYATSEGFKEINEISSDEFAKKTILSASLGGASVAASGGDEEDIIEAFVRGAALAAAREHYKQKTHEEIKGRAPSGGGLTKLDEKYVLEQGWDIWKDEDGNYIRDSNGNIQVVITSMPRDTISHVGLACCTASDSFMATVGGETSLPMETLSKIPYVNDMAYYHDEWARLARMQGWEVQVSIIPAAVLVMSVANEQPILKQMIEAAIEEADAEKKAEADEEKKYTIINKDSGFCMDGLRTNGPYGHFDGQFGNVYEYICHEGDNQLWTLVDAGNGYVTVVNKDSGGCLDSLRGSNKWGHSDGMFGNVYEHNCHGGDNQKWKLTMTDDGHTAQIINKASGGCLDALRGSNVWGYYDGNFGNIYDYSCHGGDNQRWSVLLD